MDADAKIAMWTAIWAPTAAFITALYFHHKKRREKHADELEKRLDRIENALNLAHDKIKAHPATLEGLNSRLMLLENSAVTITETREMVKEGIESFTSVLGELKTLVASTNATLIELQMTMVSYNERLRVLESHDKTRRTHKEPG